MLVMTARRRAPLSTARAEGLTADTTPAADAGANCGDPVTRAPAVAAAGAVPGEVLGAPLGAVLVACPGAIAGAEADVFEPAGFTFSLSVS